MKKNEYRQSISILEKLHSLYPTYTIAQHIATAMADYGDFWGLTDKEFLFALEKYNAELDLDEQHIVTSDYVNKIIKDAETLFDEYTEEEY